MGPATLIPALIGAIGTIGGAVYSSNAQRQAIDAQNRAQQAAMARSRQLAREEDARQEGMRKRQEQTRQDDLQKNTRDAVDEEIAQQQQEVTAPSQQIASDVAAMSPGDAALPSRADQSGTTTVQDSDLGKRLAAAADWVRQYGAAKGKVQGYASAYDNLARQSQQANQDIGFTNQLRQGSLQTANLENGLVGQSFANSIVPDTTAGDILSGIGKLGFSAYG